MKKSIVISVLAIILTMCFLFTTKVYAQEENVLNDQQSQMVKDIEKGKQTLEDYQKEYGSEAYGWTAFILNTIRIYSFPFCFLGIALSGIYQFIIGIRKLDIKEKGLTLMVTFITTFVICQILPLAFTIAVKFGRG